VITVFRSHLRPTPRRRVTASSPPRWKLALAQCRGSLTSRPSPPVTANVFRFITIDTGEHQATWRDDPQHRAAQRKGREFYYSSYSISVCEEPWHRRFEALVELA
jgi:hypothetical protein